MLDVFRRLYAERFPIRRMVPEDAYGGSDPKSMDADNTSGFNCRYAVAPGPPQWSAHAYGEAIDVNPVENPYLEGGLGGGPGGGREPAVFARTSTGRCTGPGWRSRAASS